jgi:hypothetical protein
MRKLIFVAFLVGGCGSSHHFVGSAVPSASTVTYRIAPGLGTSVSPGTVAGYGITANVGGSYRIVWTGDSNVTATYHEFWGSVWTRGTFTSLTPGCNGHCPLEADDWVSGISAVPGGERIDWDTFATDGLDGLDFTADTEPVYFDFTIDGVRYPMLVFFPATDNGGQISPVDTIPFGLTTQ